MVKILEFTNQEPQYDTVEDVTVFMRNHPLVYRKCLFPAILKMQYNQSHNKHNDPEQCLGRAVDAGMKHYCKEYNLGSLERVFAPKDREMIINKLFSEEINQIRQGKYK